jgi:hypothetical protein
LLRGGAWNNNSDNCRAAYRNNNSNRNNNYGFRVVCAAAPSTLDPPEPVDGNLPGVLKASRPAPAMDFSIQIESAAAGLVASANGRRRLFSGIHQPGVRGQPEGF